MRKILSLLISVVCLLSFSTSVYAASSTITASKTGTTKYEYIDGLPIYYNKAGGYDIYILDSNTNFDSSTTLRDPEEISGGYQYILNNSNQTSSSDKNYYITQVAILWYEDYLNGNNNNLSASIKEHITANTSDTVCYYINKLVNSAKQFANENEFIKFQDKNITFSKNGNYYYSNVIDVTTNKLSTTPSVKLYNAPSSSSIINNTVTKNGNGSFQIRIPVSSMSDYYREDFEVYITGKTSDSLYYKYSNYGTEDVVYSRSYSSSSSSIEASLPVVIDNKIISNTNVRIRVIDENNDYISNVKYYIYSGNCKNSTCDSDDYVTSFTTKNTYTTLENTLSEGTYTLVKKTSTSYDLNDKELIEVAGTKDTQVITIKADELYNNNTDAYKYVNINNSIDDSRVILKVYKENGSLVDSYRSNDTDYELKLYVGYYYIVDNNNTFKIYFRINDNGELLIKENGIYNERNSIDLDDYIDEYEYDENNDYYDDTFNENFYFDDDYYVENNNKENNKHNNKNEIKDNNIKYDKDGTINIDNLDGVSSIDVSNKVNTTTDVKIDWISNIIDTPITSLSSTLKYIVGAIILAFGILFTVKNVKKSKNNN